MNLKDGTLRQYWAPCRCHTVCWVTKVTFAALLHISTFSFVTVGLPQGPTHLTVQLYLCQVITTWKNTKELSPQEKHMNLCYSLAYAIWRACGFVFMNSALTNLVKTQSSSGWLYSESLQKCPGEIYICLHSGLTTKISWIDWWLVFISPKRKRCVQTSALSHLW